MIKSHMDARENALIAISKIPANSGHSLHKGTPREAFIKEFLEQHLPENIAIGTGEIIDADSKPNVQRNQFDLILYKKNYPKLDFGGGIKAFLVESVIATIEIKSTLTEKDMKQSISAAKNAKSLTKNTSRSFSTGYIPPSILCFVIAYDGPSNMSTVYKWIPKIHNELNIQVDRLHLEEEKRIQTASKTIDAAFVLKKGFVYFDNLPIGFSNQDQRVQNPDLKWILSDTNNGNLLFFFLLLQQSTSNLEGEWLNALPYLRNFKVGKIQFGT